MKPDGRNAEAVRNGEALRWSGRVVTAQGLLRQLNGHRRLMLPPTAIVTPLASEHLRQHRIEVDQSAEEKPNIGTYWGYTQEHEHPLVASAVNALSREGVNLKPLPALRRNEVGVWAKDIAACVAAGQCCGGVVFCGDPGLFCCISNKVPGLRSVPVVTILHAVRAVTSVGANLLAVEMPGRTFFEIRQFLRLLCSVKNCPEGIACTLRELDGHAHR